MAHRYLLISEVALVARTSDSTVRAWIRQGRLLSTKPGRRRLVRVDHLERFLQENESGQEGGDLENASSGGAIHRQGEG